MQQKLDTFAVSVNARLDHLSAVCTTLKKTEQPRDSSIQSDTHSGDRQFNIVIFGAEEDRDANAWRHRVDDILRYVAGQSVDVIDMYRLGRFTTGKIRPILVKLRVIWDKRLILSKCSKLKDYTQRGIFIAPDEPVEVRRQQTLNRLKSRAEREGKRVVVTDGILYIDGIAKFSVAAGSINNSNDG